MTGIERLGQMFPSPGCRARVRIPRESVALSWSSGRRQSKMAVPLELI